jgi:hypothetical protein
MPQGDVEVGMHLCRCSDRQAHEAVCQLAGLITLRAVGKDKTPFSPRESVHFAAYA